MVGSWAAADPSTPISYVEGRKLCGEQTPVSASVGPFCPRGEMEGMFTPWGAGLRGIQISTHNLFEEIASWVMPPGFLEESGGFLGFQILSSKWKVNDSPV